VRIYALSIAAALMLASSVNAQPQNILLEQIGVFPDAAPDSSWTIEDGKITQKNAGGSIVEFTWTKPPLEIDEEGFTLSMTINATTNSKARMEVSGDFISDPPQGRSVERIPETERPEPASTSVKIKPTVSGDAQTIRELRIAVHAGYGVTYRYRVAR
jgi:hypothetical protein